MNTTAMNNLWTYIKSLGLNRKNRQWLAEKLVEPTESEAKESADSQSLRGAFSGDWEDEIDSVSYAQILRDESVLNNGEEISW